MRGRWIAGGLLILAIAVGPLSERPGERASLVVGGYQVLAADFHVHLHPLSWAPLSPWDTVIEARRQGLDAFALASQNALWPSKAGRWFSRTFGGPTVLVSEEIHTPRYHMIAVAIHSTVDWRLTASQAIDEIHRQGGVAIAAHPIASYWPAWDAAAMKNLDATEVFQPIAYILPEFYPDLQKFYERKRLTAIGSSDYHGMGHIGICRTYVFARENTEQAILEALRAGRTVVYDRAGRAYGDPELIHLSAGLLPRNEDPPQLTWLGRLSGVAGVVGLIGMIVLGFLK